MFRPTTQLVAALALATPIALYAQHAYRAQAGSAAGGKTAAPAGQKKAGDAAPAKKAAAPMHAKSTMTDAQKIANAESAAPASISKGAMIMDWPATEGGQMRQLRAGTNGWMCMPNSPSESAAALGNDPMCLDKAWQAWADAYLGHKPPPATTSGIAYMLNGDKGASNTDPAATAPTATNQWVVTPAHTMVLFPDTTMLDAYPTDPKSGGPFVMWKGTPFAHLMVPVSATKSATMK